MAKQLGGSQRPHLGYHSIWDHLDRVVGRVPTACKVSGLQVATCSIGTSTCRLGENDVWGQEWNIPVRHGNVMVGEKR